MRLVEIRCVPSSRSWEYGPATSIADAGELRVVAVHMDTGVRVAVHVFDGAGDFIERRELEWRPWIASRTSPRRRALTVPMYVPAGGVVEVFAGRAPLVDRASRLVLAADLTPVELTIELAPNDA